MILVIFLCTYQTAQYTFPNTTLYMDHLSFKKILTIHDSELSEDSCLTFGIWSKYSPLNIQSFKNQIGMFQSNCFQLINVMEYTSQTLKFIYYVCLDNSTKRIVKMIQFVSDDDEQIKFEKFVDPMKYENVWYSFQFISWPIQKKLQLIIIESENKIFNQILENIDLFKEQQLLLTFGESLEVMNSQIDQVKQGMYLSLFPGQIVIYEPLIQSIPISFDFENQIIEGYENLIQCNCQNNEQVIIQDNDLITLDSKIYISGNASCDYYALSGWLKIVNALQHAQELSYQFMKMTPYQGQTQLFIENLATFELFYLISPFQSKIVITTYNINFPIVTNEILDNSQKIETQFQIQTDIITQWHYLFLEFKDNQLNIKITFYDYYQYDIQSYEAQVKVVQFHNCQYKLIYGNILSNSLNYLKMAIRNFQFVNCRDDQRMTKCHSSCLDCDGAGKTRCLSCSLESKRIYLPEVKQCVCPVDTIDYENKCITYLDLNLKLNILVDNYQKCKTGYFELEGDCIKCPSIVKTNFITCFECFQRAQDWAQYSYCFTVLYFPLASSTIHSSLSLNMFYYYHDGSDLINCDFCYQVNKNQDQELQNPNGVYQMFEIKSQGFQYFCFSQIEEIDDLKCTFCYIPYCVQCGIEIDQMICLICEYDLVFINGVCTREELPLLYQSCQPPYYASNKRECKLCTINNCLYCFEYYYLGDNLEYSTLQLYNIESIENQITSILVGCLLCENDYIFDFSLGKCIKQTPRIQYCLTSYVKSLEEHCIVSSLKDFQVSRVTNDCDSFIVNCSKCMLNLQEILICIECKIGYVLQDSQCYMNDEFSSNYLRELQSLQVYAFLLTYNPKYLMEFSNTEDFSYKCGQQCLKCKNEDEQYFCDECQLDYMDGPIKIQQGLYCPICPRLCQVCTYRSKEEIQSINPLFIITDENSIYTQQCLLPISDPLIFHDPYIKQAQYCFDGICHNEFYLEYNVNNCFFDRFPNTLTFFQINPEYYNHIGINTFTFNIFFEVQFELCHLMRQLQSISSLKNEVFALKTMNINFISVNPFFFVLSNKIRLIDYDHFTFINSSFIFLEQVEENIQMLNSNNDIDLTIINCSIENSSIFNVTSVFYAYQFGSINIQNFSIKNTIIKNSSLFNLQLSQFEGQMTITSLFLENCTFIDLQLFQFSKISQNIKILNLTLDSCVFQNASLFTLYINYIKEATFELKNIRIQNNNFHNSYLLFCSQIIHIDLININFNSNRMDASIIFGFSYSLSAYDIKIKENVIIGSQFLQTIEVTNDKNTDCQISKLIVEKNVLQNTNLFHIFSNSYSNKIQISITFVQIQLNLRSLNSDQQSQIFNINSKKLDLNNFFVTNNQEVRILNIYDSEYIQIKELDFQNSVVEQKVSFSINQLQRSNLQNQLILITGFDDIIIEKCKFIKQSTIDESIIEIISSKSKQLIGSIFIRDIQFFGNLLQLLNQVQSFSLLTILSDRQIDVIMEEVTYQHNFMHVYYESALKQSAALLYIISAQSNILVNNLNCNQNSLTNSSNSFIRVTSRQLTLRNILVKNHNILPFNTWKEYYPIVITNEQDQEETNIFIMQIYHIKTIGGAAQIEASKFECLNCAFEEILAARSSVFDIVTSNEGIVMISNFSVNSTTYSLVEQTEGSGSISFHSQNSILNLFISSARFSNVINRMSTSIFTIIPSLLQNKIIIQDIQILNCISLKNQIVQIQFINQIVALNSISLMNVKIVQDQKAWTIYFQIIKLLSLSEILEITGDENALIYLENCDIYIQNLIFEGILLAPVFKSINVQNLLLFNFHLENVISITTQSLIQINQIVQRTSLISLKSLNIIGAQLFQLNPQPIVYPPKLFADYVIVAQQIMNNSFLIEQPQDYFHTNLIQLQQSNYQKSSVIRIKSESNLSTIILDKINVKHNHFETIQNGIIYFDVAIFGKLRVYSLECISNFIKEYGCLHFVGNNSVTSTISIKNSNFINNNGSKGVAIKVTDISIELNNCQIISNVASTQGGALYLKITSKIFRIVKTFIINNHAYEGGGIYFEKDHNLNSSNFQYSYLLFNLASNYGNNLVENPTHLTLFINQKEMPAKIQVKDRISTSFLRILPYNIIEQGKQLEVKQLMIPSNQQINNYQLFILKGSFYISYIKNMILFFKNSKGELLYNLISSTCNVSSVIIKNDGGEVKEPTKSLTLKYESATNNFELGSLAFTLNPFEENYSHLKIQVNCKTSYSENEFRYIINAKSLKCQLGEFFFENGCQICSSSQGFYSVTYNSIKCSIFDKQKFQNITSNMINLFPGYWRPNYLSDYTESCYKNSLFCQGGWGVGDVSCQLGHTGALCEVCDVYNKRGNGQFFKDQSNFSCQSCSKNDNIVIPLLLALFQSLLSISLSLKSINKSNQLFAQLKIFLKFSKVIFKLSQDHEGILVKMLLNYLWIFSVIFTFNISFSFSFIFIEQSSNSFYFMVNNLDCYLSNLQPHLIYMKIFVILLLMILQFKLILALSLLYHNIMNNQMDNSLLSNTLLYLYVFNYGGLIKMLCSSLSVRQISNINYIQGDVSLLYNTEDHQLWIYFFILPLLIVFGCIIPFSLFLLTYIKRDILYKIKLRKHICYLFNEYTDNNYFWEQIKLLQKAIIILITTYFENNTLLKTSLLGLCLLSYQVIAVKNKPYIISKFNNLDLSSGQICSITIFLAAIKYESQNLNEFFSIFLQIFILILLVRLCYPFILNICSVYYKKYSFFILTKIHQFLKYLKLNKYCVQSLEDYLTKATEKKQKLKRNFLKLKQFLIPKSKSYQSNQRTTVRRICLRSTSSSGHQLIEGLQE
ncbi:unnamed protein product [Paramecium octaurelia]|uniref:Transmembrane protein n=2 Tax=Paramecium octaurelia TaxID=43137 RepID=A0A8S1X302_PAROT|nr:unnamed protein product [Paramecium octaurelia]